MRGLQRLLHHGHALGVPSPQGDRHGQAGNKEELLKSNSIWFCVSCYLCTARCPRDIKPASIVHGLESIALKEGYKPPTKTTTMYQTFSESIINNGRIYEFGFMFKYYLKTNPFAALKMLPTAFQLAHPQAHAADPQEGQGQG